MFKTNINYLIFSLYHPVFAIRSVLAFWEAKALPEVSLYFLAHHGEPKAIYFLSWCNLCPTASALAWQGEAARGSVGVEQ